MRSPSWIKAPPSGNCVVSSPRDCITQKAMMPTMPKPRSRDAGPPFERAPPAPTRRPGPIIPASASMLRCRFLRPRRTPESGSMVWDSRSCWCSSNASSGVFSTTHLLSASSLRFSSGIDSPSSSPWDSGALLSGPSMAAFAQCPSRGYLLNKRDFHWHARAVTCRITV